MLNYRFTKNGGFKIEFQVPDLMREEGAKCDCRWCMSHLSSRDVRLVLHVKTGSQ